MIHTKGSQRCIIKGDVIIIESESEDNPSPDKGSTKLRNSDIRHDTEMKELTQQVNTVNELQLQLKVLESKAHQIERQRQHIQASLSDTKEKLIGAKASPMKIAEGRGTPVKRVVDNNTPRYEHTQRVMPVLRAEQKNVIGQLASREELSGCDWSVMTEQPVLRAEHDKIQQRMTPARRMESRDDKMNIKQVSPIRRIESRNDNLYPKQQPTPTRRIDYHPDGQQLQQKQKEPPKFEKPKMQCNIQELQTTSKNAGSKNEYILEKLSPDELVKLATLFKNQDYVEKAAEKGGPQYAKVGKEMLEKSQMKPKPMMRTSPMPIARTSPMHIGPPMKRKTSPIARTSPMSNAPPTNTAIMRVPPPQRFQLQGGAGGSPATEKQRTPTEQKQEVAVNTKLNAEVIEQAPYRMSAISPSNFVTYRMHCRIENVNGLNPLRNLSPWQLVEMGRLFDNPMYLDLADWMSKKELFDLSDPDYQSWLSEYQAKLTQRPAGCDDSSSPTKIRRLKNDENVSEAPQMELHAAQMESNHLPPMPQLRTDERGREHKIYYVPVCGPEPCGPDPGPAAFYDSDNYDTDDRNNYDSDEDQSYSSDTDLVILPPEGSTMLPMQDDGLQKNVVKPHEYTPKSHQQIPTEDTPDQQHVAPVAVTVPPQMYTHPGWPNVAIAYIPVPIDHFPPGTVPYFPPQPHQAVPYYYQPASTQPPSTQPPSNQPPSNQPPSNQPPSNQSISNEQHKNGHPDVTTRRNHTPKPTPCMDLNTDTMTHDVRVKLEPLSPIETGPYEHVYKDSYRENYGPEIKQEEREFVAKTETTNSSEPFRLYKRNVSVGQETSDHKVAQRQETVPIRNLVRNEHDPLHKIQISVVGNNKKKGYFPMYKRPKV